MKRSDCHDVPKVIKFNWELLKQYTNSDPHKILEFLSSVYVKKTENYLYLNPWAAELKIKSRNNAHNYIQNVTELMLHTKTATDSELLVYLDLASKRSYFNFINTGGKMNYLPIWKIDTYSIDSLKMNRLLNFDENNIYLLYEIGE